MSNIMRYTATAAMRLDEFVRESAGLTRSRAQKLIADGHVLVDGARPQKSGQQLKAGQSVDVEVPPPVEMNAVAQDIPIEIVYQDEYLAVVNKPCGMVVHPAAGNPDGTLVNALLGKLDHLSGIGGELRPGILHRIDKDTTGLLLIAKNDEAHVKLSEQIAAHTVGRVYLAILQGAPRCEEGEVDAPIGRHPVDRKRMAIVRGGREAQTHYRVLAHLRGATLIEARLRTGRTHQIRVHMASLGAPVMGDPLYGARKCPLAGLDHQLLHACRIAFDHPCDGARRVFAVEPPEEFLRCFEKLGGDRRMIGEIVRRYGQESPGQ
ncbi:MAG: RluA family pseudouridine synthase [Candidatus Fimadaptatus sp.]|jgi:23S rRNA pseudouridine1911/1915/1917 synthase